MANKRASVTRHVATLELFAGCSRGEREFIERMATVTEVRPGWKLCRRGEIGQSFYVVVDGEAIVTIDGEELATLGPGCGFGEVALVSRDGRRVADVTAATPMTLVVFSRPEFAALMAEVPRVAREVVRLSGQRLSESRRRPLTATS